MTEEQQNIVEKLFEKNNKLFHRISFRLLKAHQSSEDAVHTAFLKIIEHIEKISHLSGPQMEAYCVVIVKNTSLDMIRQSKKSMLIEDMNERWEDSSSSPEEECIRGSEQAMLCGVLNQLAEEEQKLIILRHIHNMGYKEIGTLLNISEETAKKRGQRILRKLRSLYEGEEKV